MKALIKKLREENELLKEQLELAGGGGAKKKGKKKEMSEEDQAMLDNYKERIAEYHDEVFVCVCVRR